MPWAAARSANASPITHANGEAVPIVLVHGDEDGLVPPHHSLSLHDVIAAAGGSVPTRAYGP